MEAVGFAAERHEQTRMAPFGLSLSRAATSYPNP
jgi:hypothetical protein